MVNTKTEHKFQVLLDLVHDKKRFTFGAVALRRAASFFMYRSDNREGGHRPSAHRTTNREEDFAQRLIKPAGGADQLVTQLWLAGLAIIGVTVLSGAHVCQRLPLARACESTAQHLRESFVPSLAPP